MVKSVCLMGIVGCVTFTIFLLFMSFTGLASAMRDNEGNFKKEKSFKSIIGAFFFLSFIISLLYISNFVYARAMQAKPELIDLWFNSFSVFFIIHIYDLVILDYLIVIKWHPNFLNLPNTKYYTTFRPHLIGFLKGIPIGILLSLLSSLLFYYTY